MTPADWQPGDVIHGRFTLTLVRRVPGGWRIRDRRSDGRFDTIVMDEQLAGYRRSP